MVGQHFCRRAVERGMTDAFEFTVLGEESRSAYDRVHLTELLLEKQTTAGLTLAPREWYEEQRVLLKTGDPAVAIDREARTVLTRSGARYPYDCLVFATGSRANRPRFEGSDLESVVTYRDVDNALRIRALALDAISSGRPIAVLGGGLLGVEIAEALQTLGVECVVVESSSYLLPRQLTRAASRRVAAKLREAGLRLELNARVKAARPLVADGHELLRLHLDNDKEFLVRGVVVAAGVRPRDELARQSELRCDDYGGIEVDDHLRTSDPNVFAIGECARHENVCYGLVAPGYHMAEVLLDNLQGKGTRFRQLRTSCRLKVKTIELSVVGDSFLEGREVANYTREQDDNYRALVVRNGRLIGATAIGEWSSFAAVQTAVGRQQRLGDRAARRFEQGVELWRAAAADVSAWPDDAIVCSCTGVTCGMLRTAKKSGCTTGAALSERTGAATVCGTCAPLLTSLSEGVPAQVATRSRALLPLAGIAVVLALVVLAAPPMPFVDTTLGGVHLDALWRTTELRQLTGFVVLGLAICLGALSIRKRVKRVRLGSFEGWRTVHFAVGALAMIAVATHTGLHLGHNLDQVLLLVFVSAGALGGVAGGVLALERRLTPEHGAALRRTYNAMHFALTWPLPVLLLVHIVKVYFF